jgi:hypothetical protein
MAWALGLRRAFRGFLDTSASVLSAWCRFNGENDLYITPYGAIYAVAEVIWVWFKREGAFSMGAMQQGIPLMLALAAVSAFAVPAEQSGSSARPAFIKSAGEPDFPIGIRAVFR